MCGLNKALPLPLLDNIAAPPNGNVEGSIFVVEWMHGGNVSKRGGGQPSMSEVPLDTPFPGSTLVASEFQLVSLE